jgi:hypothetical protein
LPSVKFNARRIKLIERNFWRNNRNKIKRNREKNNKEKIIKKREEKFEN